MSEAERFSKFLFGVLLIMSFFVPWGKWLALMLGTLFLVSSLHGVCVGCKCKEQLVNNINKEKKQ